MRSASATFDLNLEFDLARVAIGHALTAIAANPIDEETYVRQDGTRAHWWLALAVLPFRVWVAHTIHVRARATSQGTRVLVNVIGAFGPFQVDWGGNHSLIKRLKQALGKAVL